MKTRILLLEGMAVVDARGVVGAPGAVLVRVSGPVDMAGRERCELLAAGPPGDVRRHPSAGEAQVVSRPGSVLLPGLVNAHTHLDLTHIGPREHDPEAGFVPWVEMIRRERARMGRSGGAAGPGGDAGDRGDDGVESAIQSSVARGVELSIAGGTVAVGDIAGAVGGRISMVGASALEASRMSGVSFLEFFGIGAHEERATAAVGEIALEVARSSVRAEAVRLGLQPHAPYSVGPGLYAKMGEFGKAFGVRLSTHLAESPEEQQLIESGDGPLADLLRGVGAWDDGLAEVFANPGVSPVQFAEHALRIGGGGRFAAAHVNQADDHDIQILAKTRTSVVYCPRASAYFGAERCFGPHRYRDMLAAGVNVALGTDSIVNLPPHAADPARGGISVLDEMRLLHRRDGTDPYVLLAMGTVNGARALGLHAAAFQLSGPLGGVIGGVLAVEVGEGEGDPLARVLKASSRPEVLAFGAV